MMTERRGSNKVFLGVATAVLTAAVIYLVSSVWATKLDVTAFNVHVATDERREQGYKLDRQLDSVWHAQQGAEMDEMLCTIKPKSQRCQ